MHPSRALLVGAVAALAGAAPVAVRAQDSSGTTPGALAQGPADGIAHYRASLRARALIAERKDPEAEALLERLTAEYPRNGEHWLLLAGTRARQLKYATAAAAYEQAGRILGLRSPTGFIPVNAAVNHLKAGDRGAALRILRRYVFEEQGQFRIALMDIAGLAPLRDDPDFREIAGLPSIEGLDKEAGRRLDVDYLYAEVQRANQDATLPAEFTTRYRALRDRVGSLSEEEFVVQLNVMLAALRWGHTELLGGTIDGKVNQLPVQFHLFADGLFVVRASDEHRALVGSRLVAIGDTDALDALRRMNRMQSVDGDMEYLLNGTYLLRAANYLRGSGIIPRADTVSITVESAQGRRTTARIATGSYEGWQKLPRPAGAAAMLYMDSTAQNHWHTVLPKHDAVYVQVNQMRNDSSETLPEFGRRLWTVLAAAKPTNVILDLRHNTGGSTALYPELLKSVIAFAREPGRRVYALIGRTTYSAAGNFITDLERLVNPVFVGEPSSECCNLHGDPALVRLPYSGRRGSLSIVRWNLSGDAFDGRREMVPHVPIPVTSADYFAGRDPVMEAVLRLIAEAK